MLCVLNQQYLELDIHERSTPQHLERIAPHGFDFQPIHLSGSFILIGFDGFWIDALVNVQLKTADGSSLLYFRNRPEDLSIISFLMASINSLARRKSKSPLSYWGECRLREWRNDGFRFLSPEKEKKEEKNERREKRKKGERARESPSGCFFLGPDGLFTGSIPRILGQYVVVSIEVASIRQVLALLGERKRRRPHFTIPNNFGR
ncbi:hypothetical protein AVEN_227171-1 [Araneus ventricosus]|uniref:Uncharacterized protein n=1 Tax=Araneus ventricosus TaxID=182803 RepID=A0A4Y2BUS6_ARAVE|nr:hypothetical protein AVEN_227171-1 [Araneus ventricosus]